MEIEADEKIMTDMLKKMALENRSKKEKSLDCEPRTTEYDENTQIYTETSFHIKEGHKICQTVKYKNEKETESIKRSVLLRREILKHKFGLPLLKKNISVVFEPVELVLIEEKKEEPSTIISSIRCNNCKKAGHFTKDCPNKTSEDLSSKILRIPEKQEPDSPSRDSGLRSVDHSPVIKVSNFPLETTVDDLYGLFGHFGSVSNIKIMTERDDENKSRGYGFVTFMSREDAEDALKAVQGHKYGRMVLNLEWGKTVSEMREERERKGKEQAVKSSVRFRPRRNKRGK